MTHSTSIAKNKSRRLQLFLMKSYFVKIRTKNFRVFQTCSNYIERDPTLYIWGSVLLSATILFSISICIQKKQNHCWRLKKGNCERNVHYTNNHLGIWLLLIWEYSTYNQPLTNFSSPFYHLTLSLLSFNTSMIYLTHNNNHHNIRDFYTSCWHPLKFVISLVSTGWNSY